VGRTAQAITVCGGTLLAPGQRVLVSVIEAGSDVSTLLTAAVILVLMSSFSHHSADVHQVLRIVL